jgi:hypothetical protein
VIFRPIAAGSARHRLEEPSKGPSDASGMEQGGPGEMGNGDPIATVGVDGEQVGIDLCLGDLGCTCGQAWRVMVPKGRQRLVGKRATMV